MFNNYEMNSLSFTNYTDDYTFIVRDIFSNFPENEKLIIFLNGNMGVGKTSLCNAIGKFFNVFDVRMNPAITQQTHDMKSLVPSLS